MDELQNTAQPKPKRTSIFGISTGQAFLTWTGVAIGADAVIALFTKSKLGIRNVTTAAGWGATGAVLHLLFRKSSPKHTAADVPPAQPPAPPPAQPERPDGLALANTPQILDILVAEGALTAEQQSKILADIKTGRTGFAGELAVADGFVTQQQVDTALITQAARKTDAALLDIQAIGTHGSIPTPKWLKANWGNNGINPAPAAPTITDGASAAANIAQNLVMLANSNPDPKMQPVIAKGVMAAAYLSRGIAQGDSPTVPLAKMGDVWRETMNNALILAVQSAPDSPHAPRDAQGKPVDVYEFIAARNAEVAAGVAQSLQQPPQRSAGQGR